MKNCSNGEPGGKIGISGPLLFAEIVWLDETFTTAGKRRAARSAKLSGAERAMATSVRLPNGTGETSAKLTPRRAARATEERSRRMIGFPGDNSRM